MKRLGAFLKPYWHWAVLAPLLMALEVWMDLMQPRMIQRIIDEDNIPYDGAGRRLPLAVTQEPTYRPQAQPADVTIGAT